VPVFWVIITNIEIELIVSNRASTWEILRISEEDIVLCAMFSSQRDAITVQLAIDVC
jgi:hypothetical protein